jgi:TonB family protein
MIEWLWQQTLLLSALLLFLVLSRKQLLNFCGARGYYNIWALIPFAMLFTSLIHHTELLSVFGYNINYAVLNDTSLGLAKVYIGGIDGFMGLNEFIVTVWALGAIALCIFILANHVTFIRKVKVASTFNEIGAEILETDKVESPMLVGFFHFRMLVPIAYSTLTPLQKNLIQAHEKVHFNRKDSVWNVGALSIVCLHWFNPLVWLGYRDFRLVQEISCDAKVLENCDKNIRTTYAKTMLQYAICDSRKPITGLYYGGKKHISDRILNIQSGFMGKRKLMPLFILLAILVLLTGTMLIRNGQSYLEESVSPRFVVNPEYPALASEKGLEGSVKLRFDVESDGRVSNVRILEFDNNGIFNSAAKLVFAQWVFEAPERKLHNREIVLDFTL